MSERKKTATPEKFFRDMTRKEKISFIGKAAVFFMTGGFVYPTMWTD